MIDLRRLQVLRVLHKQGTVTAAAAALHLTPSAVSQQIRQLSREVGVDLLLHEGRRVRLTPAAHTLLGHADALYARWELARADLAAHDGTQAGELRLCGFPTGIATILAPATARLRTTHPGLEVRVTEASSLECFDLLLANDADVGLVVATADNPPVGDPRFEQRLLLDDPLDLLVPAGHRLAGRSSVDLAELADESWIVPVSGCIDHRHVTLSACTAAGFAPKITHHASEWPAVVALVAYRFGVCLMPRLAPLPADSPVTRIPLRDQPAPARRILTSVRRGSDRQPGIALGLEALREIGAGHPPPEFTCASHDSCANAAHGPGRAGVMSPV